MHVADRANPPPPTEASLVYLKVRGGEPLPIRRAAAESFATIKNMLDDTGAEDGTVLAITQELEEPLVGFLIQLAEASDDQTLPPTMRPRHRLEALPPLEVAGLMPAVLFLEHTPLQELLAEVLAGALADLSTPAAVREKFGEGGADGLDNADAAVAALGRCKPTALCVLLGVSRAWADRVRAVVADEAWQRREGYDGAHRTLDAGSALANGEAGFDELGALLRLLQQWRLATGGGAAVTRLRTEAGGAGRDFDLAPALAAARLAAVDLRPAPAEEYPAMELALAQAAALVCVATQSAALESLEARKLPTEAQRSLAAAVLGSKSLLSFGGVPMKELRADELTELDLSSKGLGPTEARVLGSLVAVSEALTSIECAAQNLAKSEPKPADRGSLPA